MKPDTIAALSSGALPAGIAVVRVSGPAAREALMALAGRVPPPRRAALAHLRDAAGDMLDRSLVFLFDAPGTATGEDIAEFHLHGGRAVVASVLDALFAVPGVRLAQAGEFTRRAFENGAIDLTEAEGLADLLAAETEAQRRQALAQAGGTARALFEDWMARLTRIRALLEASFDFADEGDVGVDAARPVRRLAADLAGEMRAYLAKASRGEVLRHGFKVAIVGPPNAGKSTLLNALAEREVAIVTDTPGTTRDVLEVALDLGGMPVRLFDTAGLRDTADAVEAIGIARARTAMAAADLVVALQATDTRQPHDLATHVKRADGAFLIRVETKADLAELAGDGEYDLRISAVTGEGLGELMERIAGIAAAHVGDPAEVVPTRVRHREAVASAIAHLEAADDPGLPPEFAAEALRLAGDDLGRLTGKRGVEDILGVIFSEFCVGK